MKAETMSFKAKLRNYAQTNNIAAQVVLQNYMFERFLERLSGSEYKEKFVVKGGMLISAIVGLDVRATMDLDATLRGLPLTEESLNFAISEICGINLNDGTNFEVKSIVPIRKGDIYGGFCVKLDAVYDTIITPLAIDVSTGDIITPAAVKYNVSGMFDETTEIELWGYNIETVLAEKIETILSRGAMNTRPRDYYDVYIIVTTQEYDKNVFKDALKATMEHRGTSELMEKVEEILDNISDNRDLRYMWEKYRKKFPYAAGITYESTVDAIRELMR